MEGTSSGENVAISTRANVVSETSAPLDAPAQVPFNNFAAVQGMNKFTAFTLISLLQLAQTPKLGPHVPADHTLLPQPTATLPP